MRRGFLILVLLLSAGVAWAQSSSAPGKTPDGSSSPSGQSPEASAPTSSAPSQTSQPSAKFPPANPEPPRSDSVNAATLDNEPGESSSKDTQIDLSPPPGDDKSHPQSSDTLTDVEAGPGGASVGEFHPWDPHKAAKDIEVGDFYFKRKNYRAAEDRYREALLYKDNDANATFRLAECLEKMDRPAEARQQYERYLKILPHGPEAERAAKAIERLKGPSAEAKPAK